MPIDLLYNQGPLGPFTGSTLEIPILTVPIPAGILGNNGALRIAYNTTQSNNVNGKAFKLYLAGSNIAIWSVANASDSASVMRIRLQNALNNLQVALQSEMGFGGNLINNAFPSVNNFNFTQQLLLTLTLANGADSVTLNYFMIETMRVPGG